MWRASRGGVDTVAGRGDTFAIGSTIWRVCNGDVPMDHRGSRLESLLVDVFREQRPRLHGYLRRAAVDETAAEDLLQETFLRLWDHREALVATLQGDDPACAESTRLYIWRIARNLAVDEVRLRVRRGVPAFAESGELVCRAPSADRALEWADNLRVIEETAARLPNDMGRRCLLLWMKEIDLETIAVETGLSLNQARGLLQRAKTEVIARASERLKARLPMASKSERSAG